MSAPESWLARYAQQRADHPALISAHGTLSYAALEVDARSLAAKLRGLGIKAGDRVPVLLENDPLYVANCLDFSEHNTSFISGHATTSATLAGLICSRHIHRPERRHRDLLVCGGAASLSLAVGILRITADQHFTTDVIVGWATGALFGYLLPSRFTYGRWRWGRDRDRV